MKKLLISIIVIALTFCSCMSLHTDIKDKEKYGQWDNRVKSELNSCFEGSLPNKSLVDNYCTDYHYTFYTTAEENPVFNIYADLSFDNIDDFNSEISRFSGYDFADKNGITYYLIQFSSEDLNELLNDNVYDTMEFHFEIAAADKQNQKIRYLSSRSEDQDKSSLIHKELLLEIIE